MTMKTAPIWAAVITALVTALGFFYNQWMARKAERRKAEQEQAIRQRELALKVMEEIAKEPTAARRFAVGLVKVIGIAKGDEESGFELNDRSAERGKTHFIPINSRVSLGRDQNNDIYLYDAALKSGDGDRNRELSRFQCGFVTELADVVVEDYLSANGTLVEDPNGSVRLELEEGESKKELKFSRKRERTLADGDHILVGPFVLRFVKLKPNEMLAR
jgi:hypothetical protein